jgi:hypothetical protein
VAQPELVVAQLKLARQPKLMMSRQLKLGHFARAQPKLAVANSQPKLDP